MFDTTFSLLVEGKTNSKSSKSKKKKKKLELKGLNQGNQIMLRLG